MRGVAAFASLVTAAAVLIGIVVGCGGQATETPESSEPSDAVTPQAGEQSQSRRCGWCR